MRPTLLFAIWPQKGPIYESHPVSLPFYHNFSCLIDFLHNKCRIIIFSTSIFHNNQITRHISIASKELSHAIENDLVDMCLIFIFFVDHVIWVKFWKLPVWIWTIWKYVHAFVWLITIVFNTNHQYSWRYSQLAWNFRNPELVSHFGCHLK